MRPVAPNLGEQIAESPWLSELDDVSVGHGVSLLWWRSGGVKHPHDTPPYPFIPSPTSAHSSRPLSGGRSTGQLAEQNSMTTKTICLISTVRTTVRQTICFVNYHLSAGIDEIILFFDDPNDPAAEVFSDYVRVRSIKCDNKYWAARGTAAPLVTQERQEINVNYGLKLAAESGFDWIIHIDSDELLMSKGDIKNILSLQSGDVVRFSMKEAVSEKDHYENIFEATLFKEPVTKEKYSQIALALSLGCEGVFFEGVYFRGHMASKVAVRINSKIEWMGIHRPLRPKMAVIETDLITLLHYDCVGIEDWRNKWISRLDKPEIMARLRPHRVRQQELFKKAYGNAAAELELYSRLHKISEHQKSVLMQHGLLTVITLQHELFERPAVR
jgi:hypothetical protein